MSHGESWYTEVGPYSWSWRVILIADWDKRLRDGLVKEVVSELVTGMGQT